MKNNPFQSLCGCITIEDYEAIFNHGMNERCEIVGGTSTLNIFNFYGPIYGDIYGYEGKECSGEEDKECSDDEDSDEPSGTISPPIEPPTPPIEPPSPPVEPPTPPIEPPTPPIEPLTPSIEPPLPEPPTPPIEPPHPEPPTPPVEPPSPPELGAPWHIEPAVSLTGHTFNYGDD